MSKLANKIVDNLLARRTDEAKAPDNDKEKGGKGGKFGFFRRGKKDGPKGKDCAKGSDKDCDEKDDK